jgi:cupin superfamily acireductone dioxygenase involved in methionine salvage
LLGSSDEQKTRLNSNFKEDHQTIQVNSVSLNGAMLFYRRTDSDTTLVKLRLETVQLLILPEGI